MLTLVAFFFGYCSAQMMSMTPAAMPSSSTSMQNSISVAPTTVNPGDMMTVSVMTPAGGKQTWSGMCPVFTKRMHMVVVADSLGGAAHVHADDFSPAPTDSDTTFKFPFQFKWSGRHGLFFDWMDNANMAGGCTAQYQAMMMDPVEMMNNVDPPMVKESSMVQVSAGPAFTSQEGPTGCGLFSSSQTSFTCTFQAIVKTPGTPVTEFVPYKAVTDVSSVPPSTPVVQISLTAMTPPTAGSCTVFKFEISDARTKQPLKTLSPYLGAAAHAMFVGEKLSAFVHGHAVAAESLSAQLANNPSTITCTDLGGFTGTPPAAFGPVMYAHATFKTAGTHLIAGQLALADSSVVYWFYHMTVRSSSSSTMMNTAAGSSRPVSYLILAILFALLI